MSIIECRGLTRTFAVRAKGEDGGRRRRTTVTAVDDITATVEAGESVGYIGANGAGKSTTIKMLTGILVPSAGSVRTCGLEPVRQRRDLARRIGVVFGQRSQLWWDLPLAESYRVLSALHRIGRAEARRRVDTLTEELELGGFLQTPVRQLSLGQRMRGEVAAALLHRPELLILDEPTIGLDMISKQRLRQFLIRQQQERNTTLLLTTHDMDDIERLCRRVLVVDHGRIVYDGGLDRLRERTALERTLVIDFAEPLPALELAGARRVDYELDGLRQSFRFHPGRTTAAQLLAAANEQGGVVRDLTLDEPDIEDIVATLYTR